MTDVLFRFDVDAGPQQVLAALTTAAGIQAFWTTEAEVPTEVGQSLRLDFEPAPETYDLRLERSDESTVVWRTQIYPPHWVGTTITWQVQPRDGGSTVEFRHAGYRDDAEAGRVAYTWGQIMTRLKDYAEHGTVNPLFA